MHVLLSTQRHTKMPFVQQLRKHVERRGLVGRSHNTFSVGLLLILRLAPVSASPTWTVRFDLSGDITAVKHTQRHTRPLKGA